MQLTNVLLTYLFTGMFVVSCSRDVPTTE